MKKLKMSIVALTISIISYGQSVTTKSDSILVSVDAKNARLVHENLYAIVNNLEDMLSMLDQDVDSGFIENQYVGFYQELLKQTMKLAGTVEIKE
tara:strand:+ start:354 stop:638 length:285 start_codon:yes stop_codon:yes gene_type:complete